MTHRNKELVIKDKNRGSCHQRKFTKPNERETTETHVKYVPISKPHTRSTCHSESVDAPSTWLGWTCTKSIRRSIYVGRKASRRK